MSLLVQRIIIRLYLKTFFSGVFVEVTPSPPLHLQPRNAHIVEHYVTWGFLNLKSLQELILKRGQVKVKSKTIPSGRQHSYWGAPGEVWHYLLERRHL